MIRKLRCKFVCVAMILVTVMLVAMMSLQYRSARIAMEQDRIEDLQAASESLLGNIRGKHAARPCFLLSVSGRGVLMAYGDRYYDLSDRELLGKIWQAAVDTRLRTGVLEEYSLAFLRQDSLLGTRYAFTDISAEIQTLKILGRNCILIGMAGFFAFLAVSILLVRWITGPVEKAWQQQRQFVADASHELKTPLTVILTNAELLQSGSCGQEERQFAENILAMSRQMRGLVASLLQLARADCGQTPGEAAPLDFSRLTEDALLPFEPLYFEQGLTLESHIAPGIRLTGNDVNLRQVVEILLDNGQKYSSPGGTARLTLKRQGKNTCLLRFSTPGEALTAQQCRDIFKRFYRVDEARSMNHSYGLGLAIARQIVTDHRGKIWAESSRGENVFFVTLPLTANRRKHPFRREDRHDKQEKELRRLAGAYADALPQRLPVSEAGNTAGGNGAAENRGGTLRGGAGGADDEQTL